MVTLKWLGYFVLTAFCLDTYRVPNTSEGINLLSDVIGKAHTPGSGLLGLQHLALGHVRALGGANDKLTHTIKLWVKILCLVVKLQHCMYNRSKSWKANVIHNARANADAISESVKSHSKEFYVIVNNNITHTCGAVENL